MRRVGNRAITVRAAPASARPPCGCASQRGDLRGSSTGSLIADLYRKNGDSL
jgi:hypothetical protein